VAGKLWTVNPHTKEEMVALGRFIVPVFIQATQPSRPSVQQVLAMV